MNRTAVIFKDELFTTLKRKGFILTTLALPVLGLLGIILFQLISGAAKPSSLTDVPRIGYVDQVGIFNQYTQQGKNLLVAYSSSEQAKQDLVAGNIKEYFVIPDDYLNTGSVTRYSMKTELEPPADILNASRDFLISNLLRDNVSFEVATRIKSPLVLSSVVLDKAGNIASGQGGFGAYAVSYIFSILLIMSIFTASGYLLQGLSEEKENRIMEILLSSVSTRQLITGKVLALGASGLIQIIVWLLTGYALISLGSASIGGYFTTLHFSSSVIFLSLIYFILGYFLFAILMAGVGAIAPTQRDGQQMSIIFSLLGAIPFFLMPFIIENGEHLVTKILTIFPLTAPLTVMIRINSAIPIWELVVSVSVLILTGYGCLLLASRIFRTYLLMYGKTPGWREIIKSLRQSN
jgi:ABC-2 type transport system permease protein